MNIKDDKTHNFKGYEIMRCSTVLKSIWQVFDKYETGKLKMTQKDLDDFQVLKPYSEKLHNLTCCFKNQVNSEEDKSVLWESAQKVVTECKITLREINKLRLPEPKCRYLEWTDAGPGVGVTNHDVQFRTAQKLRIINADYLIRLHLANGGSAQNEVERCQGYVGDAICDRGILEREYKKLLDDKNLEHLRKMTSEELKEYELRRMKYNVGSVCDEIVSRIDDASGLEDI